MEHVKHNFDPVFNQNSEILILGTFPSVKSRENQFYYGHPLNRFWKVLSAVYEENLPISIEEKKAFLLRNKIALWDVIDSCDIKGSSDSSIRNVIANDISAVLRSSKIRRIYTNGGTADRLYQRYCFPSVNRAAVKLPSTSPANAASTLGKLIDAWSILKTI